MTPFDYRRMLQVNQGGDTRGSGPCFGWGTVSYDLCFWHGRDFPLGEKTNGYVSMGVGGVFAWDDKVEGGLCGQTSELSYTSFQVFSVSLSKRCDYGGGPIIWFHVRF
jgi:hypothetical protein